MPRRIPLSLELLETFVCVVRNDGDAAVSARQLGINQPSMSKRLKSLQYAGSPLKHPWLERVGKTWRLTVEGERVLPAVRELLQRHRQLTGFVAAGQQERVRIACGQWAAAETVVQSLVQFRERCPEVPVRISTMRGRQRIEGVATGILDFAVVSHDPAQILEIARRPLVTEVLAAEPLVLACCRNTPWASELRKFHNVEVTPERVRSLPLVLPEPDAGLRQPLDEWFDRVAAGQELSSPKIAVEAGGWTTILNYTRCGLGVGIVPRAFVRRAKDLVVCEIDTGMIPAVTARLICRPSATSETGPDLARSAHLLYDLLREQFGRGHSSAVAASGT